MPHPEKFSPEWWDLWTMPEPNTGCRFWLGVANNYGYGLVGVVGKKSPQLVHRMAYLQFCGPIADGMTVCHRCDHPLCAEPSHLFLGSHGDNMRDMFGKGRARPRGKVPCDRTQQMVDLLTAYPEYTLADLAREMDLSYVYVQRIAAEGGIAVKRAKRGTRPRGRSKGWRAA